jgi:hypothetical protein
MVLVVSVFTLPCILLALSGSAYTGAKSRAVNLSDGEKLARQPRVTPTEVFLWSRVSCLRSWYKSG